MKLATVARRAATVLVVGAGVAFLALTIRRNWTDIAAYEWEARWGQLSVSIAALAGTYAWAAFIWKRVLARFATAPTGFSTLLRISLVSRIARFIPGKVWQFVAVGQLSARSGLSPRVMVSSMLVQAGFILLSGIITASVILAELIPAVPSDPTVVLPAAVALALVGSHPRIIGLCLALLSKVARRETIAWTGGWRASAELMLLSLVHWAMNGIAFYLFADAIVRLELPDILPLTGIYAFAFIAGYVAFVAPAGIGVREATMASLLRPLIPSGAAAIVAIAARLWTIAAELLGVVLVLLFVPERRIDGRGGVTEGDGGHSRAGPEGPGDGG
ncbi:MAG: lysylphosphatidylglycerol synthase domain-containing protein [Longimicrobiales bacterium]|nr:lysylphosphatidylglycerol synthase domain-containing protein [Longimicrobiales bacterium]